MALFHSQTRRHMISEIILNLGQMSLFLFRSGGHIAALVALLIDQSGTIRAIYEKGIMGNTLSNYFLVYQYVI